MWPYAQTHLQLFQQLAAVGVRRQDVIRVRDTHALAMTLFVGSFRGSGKPLLAHLIGTASVLTAIGARTDVIAAGLLHAAYALGDFGEGRFGMTERKRGIVRAAVGPDIECLVAHYTQFAWTPQRIATLRETMCRDLSEADRDALTIRLCNELEDYHDYGALCCRNGAARREHLSDTRSDTIAAAEALGQHALATEIDRVFGAALALPVPLEWLGPRDYTFVLTPASCCARWRVTVRRFCDSHPIVASTARRLVAARDRLRPHANAGGDRESPLPDAPVARS
jgi:hypothetical protein